VRATDLIKRADRRSATKLDLSGAGLTYVPDAIGSLTKLAELDLSDNRLTVLPEALGSLTALENLDLGSNGLTTLPKALGNLTALTTLDLGGNGLTVLPRTLGDLAALTTLYLDRNGLTELPETLGGPGHLSLLDQTPGTPALHEVTTPTPFATTDADYRELHTLFTALDTTRTARRRLGGLSAAQDPDGRTIYLCTEHAPKRP
jgi:Leucine-rich repeat (LRR) protein